MTYSSTNLALRDPKSKTNGCVEVKVAMRGVFHFRAGVRRFQIVHHATKVWNARVITTHVLRKVAKLNNIRSIRLLIMYCHLIFNYLDRPLSAVVFDHSLFIIIILSNLQILYW